MSHQILNITEHILMAIGLPISKRHTHAYKIRFL